MTTAHRPTFDPAKGRKLDEPSSISHPQLLPAHKQLKFRRVESGGRNPLVQKSVDELRQDLLEKERRHFDANGNSSYKDRFLEAKVEDQKLIAETYEERKERVLQESKHLDDSSSESDSESSSECESDEDETEQLIRELEKVKREKAKEKEEAEKEAAEIRIMQQQEAPKVAKSWRNSTVFRKQQQSEQSEKDLFVNDMLKSDFHKRFMKRYVR